MQVLRGSSIIFALVAAILSSAAPVAAQRDPFVAPDPPGTRIPITLVLSERQSAPVALRRPGARHSNVLLLDSTTISPRILSDAVFGLLVAEAQDPNEEARSENAASRLRPDIPHRVYPWAAEAMTRLRLAAPQPVRGIGNRRALQIWMNPVQVQSAVVRLAPGATAPSPSSP